MAAAQAPQAPRRGSTGTVADQPLARNVSVRGQRLFRHASRIIMLRTRAESAVSGVLGHQNQMRHINMFEEDESLRNQILTAKYTWYNFVFKNLVEQLSQYANVYFLIGGTLQMIPEISNADGRPLTYIPLFFVLLAGAIKDGVEDCRRYASDKQENAGRATKLSIGLEESTLSWEDIHPGMLFKVRSGERVPADGLLLATSREDGDCFVETANLDGEANLKKKTPVYTPEQWQKVQRNVQAGGKIGFDFEAPVPDLTNFRGAIMEPEGEMKGAFMTNMLLRGTYVQKTDWAICLATYTGHDTRVMQNSKQLVGKSSILEGKLNTFILTMLLLQISGCCILAYWGVSFDYDENFNSMWYLAPEPPGEDSRVLFRWLVKMGTWFLQTSTVVPISLMVTLTGLKFSAGVVVSWDERCGDPENGKAARVNTSQVIESLGEVTHVFSDKTGTLTKNVMEYRACSVGGKMYGMSESSAESHVEAPHVSFKADEFLKDLQMPALPGRDDSSMGDVPSSLESGMAQPRALAAFLLAHALCHTVEANGTPELDMLHMGGPEEPSYESRKDPYQAASPDELALVWAAHALGISFLSGSKSEMELLVTGKEIQKAVDSVVGWRHSGQTTQSCIMDSKLHVELLDLCEFDNERKRMSVVVRFPNGNILMLLKGADSSVLPHVAQDPQAVLTIEQHLSTFANQGLRTLCLASRVMTEQEYRPWHERYLAAQAVVSDEREERIARCVRELEENMGPLNLLGATAIDDRLQDEVPAVIEQLRQAGIAVWVLTGDKVETAISIAWSSKLIDSSMQNFVVEELNEEHVTWLAKEVRQAERPCMTIAGSALTVVLKNEKMKAELAEALSLCVAVICCRVSPKQKADVVQLVKAFTPGAVTLAIGDGANDVAMIITAHVGVGLSGKEGAQAAATGDFAISEFKYLRRLLFVHGRENYRRLSLLILYNFYKNMLLVVPTVLTAYFSGASGVVIFHALVIQGFNLIFTNITVVFYGMFDRGKANLDDLEMDPGGWGKKLYNIQFQLLWLVTAFLQGFMYNLLAFRLLQYGRGNAGSVELNDLFTTGEIRFIWVVLGANLTLAMHQNSWFWFSYLAYAFNVVTFFLCTWAISQAAWPTYVTWHALVGADLPRILAASLAAMAFHFILNELLIGDLLSSHPIWNRCCARPSSPGKQQHGLLVGMPTEVSELHSGHNGSSRPLLIDKDRSPPKGSPAQMLPAEVVTLTSELAPQELVQSRHSADSFVSVLSTPSERGFAFSKECEIERGRSAGGSFTAGAETAIGAAAPVKAEQPAAAAAGTSRGAAGLNAEVELV